MLVHSFYGNIQVMKKVLYLSIIISALSEFGVD